MFKQLKPEDHRSLQEYFDVRGWNLCEYSLPSIIIWNHCVYDVNYRIEGGLLFISEIEMDKPENRRLLLPLTRPFRAPPPAELAGWAAKLGYRQYYHVGEDYLEAAGQAEVEKFFSVREQHGYMDYIYDTADLAGLKGHKYAKKRNLLSQFQKQVREKRTVSVAPITQADAPRCMALLNEWKPAPESGEGAELLDCERKAIINGLRSFERLGMRGITVSIDGKLSGFAFGSQLSEDTFVLNFEKALDGVKGLYQFLDNEFARSLPPQYTRINKESDLGKPGLAKAKESYYPCRKIRSYILTLKTH